MKLGTYATMQCCLERKADFGRGCTFERPSSPMSDSPAYIREGKPSFDSKLDNRSCKSWTKSFCSYPHRILSKSRSFNPLQLRSSEQHVCNIHSLGRLSELAGSSTTSRQTSARERSGLSVEGTAWVPGPSEELVQTMGTRLDSR